MKHTKKGFLFIKLAIAVLMAGILLNAVKQKDFTPISMKNLTQISDVLVEITPETFDVILDIRYASTNNVCEKELYDAPRTYLHKDAAKMLKKAVSSAKELGFKIKIFDAFRPIQVQQFMFEFFSTDTYKRDFFSNPSKGSVPHCRGVGIDVTLTDLDGNELDMGSDFDELSSLAFHDSTQISQEALKNRQALRKIMTDAGFDSYSKEWWHYQSFKPREYEVLDVIKK